MIMSPFVLDRNVPLIGLPKGGPIGADTDEQEGVGTSGSAGAGAQQTVAGRGCGSTAARELPAGEAAVEAISGGRGGGAEAPQRGTQLESRLRGEVSAAGAAASAGKVRRSGGRALWSDAGGRALGMRRRAEGPGRNAAAVDVGGRGMESGAKTAAAPSSAGAQRAFWRDGADGRQFSRLAGGARPAGLLDRFGRRRDQHDVGATGRARDDLGGGGCAARLDRALRGAAVGVRGLEESVQTSGHGEGAVARRRAGHAVWADVREAGDRGDRSQFAASQGTSGAATRHASGPAGEKAKAEGNRQSRSSERIPGNRISGGAQSSVCASGGEGRGLPSTRAAGGRVGPDFLFGEGADDQQRRGGAVSESVVPTGAAEPPQFVGAGQSLGVRRATREHRHRVSRAGAAVAGNSGTSTTHQAREQARGESSDRTEAAAGTAEVGAAEQPPVARGGPPRRAATSQEVSSDRGAVVVGLALRSALTAPPFGLRRATLRARPTTKKRRKTKSKKQKGD